ncbi:MAG TPA: hypothetical protein VGD05_13010, partial [Pyrinomonadaceae bacterium]
MDKQGKIEQWEKIKSKGFTRFIVERGILRFGLPVVLLTRITSYLIDYGFTFDYVEPLLTRRNILSLLFMPFIAGVFFGLILWITGEKY